MIRIALGIAGMSMSNLTDRFLVVLSRQANIRCSGLLSGVARKLGELHCNSPYNGTLIARSH